MEPTLRLSRSATFGASRNRASRSAKPAPLYAVPPVASNASKASASPHAAPPTTPVTASATSSIPPTPPPSSSSTTRRNPQDDFPLLPCYLEHLITAAPSDELSLRSTYMNNVLAQTSRPSSPVCTGASSAMSARTRRPSDPATMAASGFTTNLSPSSALPPAFITSFVRRCFTADLCLVDFTQALTAMDYLKVLDDRRRREVAAVLRRIGADQAILRRDRRRLEEQQPHVGAWLHAIEDKARKVEALYTQVYIGLRRWALINEMRLTPFNKPNCIAMLNTLYPPTSGVAPTVQLTETILNSQRNAFFHYIQAVEKSGRGVLRKLENAGRRPDDVNGWPVVRDLVDVFLCKANDIIEDCQAVRRASDLMQPHTAPRGESLVKTNVPPASQPPPSDQRPTTPPSLPLTARNTHFSAVGTPSPPPLKKNAGTFDRIARELRRIKSRSADHKDGTDLRGNTGPGLSTRLALRKMKSTTALHREGVAASGRDSKLSRGQGSNSSNSSYGSGPGQIPQDRLTRISGTDEAQRERLLREARRDKETRRLPRPMPSPTHFPASEAPPLPPPITVASLSRPLAAEGYSPSTAPAWGQTALERPSRPAPAHAPPPPPPMHPHIHAVAPTSASVSGVASRNTLTSEPRIWKPLPPRGGSRHCEPHGMIPINGAAMPAELSA